MSKKKPGNVTSLQDLADLAGVSRATASRALNDSPVTSAKTKRKLIKLAEKHGYSINRQARDFRLRRTSVISVVFLGVWKILSRAMDDYESCVDNPSYVSRRRCVSTMRQLTDGGDVQSIWIYHPCAPS